MMILIVDDQKDGLKDVKVMMYSADTNPETTLQATRPGALDFVIEATMAFDRLVARIAELAGEPPEPIPH